MARRDELLLIDVAINGAKSNELNPNIPISPEEIIDDVERVLDAGATIIHSHNSDFRLKGDDAALDYLKAWGPLTEKHPDIFWYPTATSNDFSGGYSNSAKDMTHLTLLKEKAGVQIGCWDPGPTRLAAVDDDGNYILNVIYNSPLEDLDRALDFLSDHQLGAEIGIYEPGALHAALHFYRAGRIPVGSIINLYFCGRGAMMEMGNAIRYGLAPTEKAFDAYLEMLDDVDLPWKVSVWGDDIMQTPIAELAIRNGGHIQIGLENHVQPERQVDNVTLMNEAMSFATKLGRKVATPDQGRDIMGISRV